MLRQAGGFDAGAFHFRPQATRVDHSTCGQGHTRRTGGGVGLKKFRLMIDARRQRADCRHWLLAAHLPVFTRRCRASSRHIQPLMGVHIASTFDGKFRRSEFLHGAMLKRRSSRMGHYRHCRRLAELGYLIGRIKTRQPNFAPASMMMIDYSRLIGHAGRYFTRRSPDAMMMPSRFKHRHRGGADIMSCRAPRRRCYCLAA